MLNKYLTFVWPLLLQSVDLPESTSESARVSTSEIKTTNAVASLSRRSLPREVLLGWIETGIASENENECRGIGISSLKTDKKKCESENSGRAENTIS